MIPKNIEQLFKKTITESTGTDCIIEKTSILGGGDINQSLRLQTNEGEFFMKSNKAGLYPQMFEKEAKGLNLLRETGEIKIPKVIGYNEDSNNSILVLEYINSSGRNPDFWEDFGKSLAQMHNHYGEFFGLDHNNYIGNLFQSNKQHKNWINFFIEERLEKQICLAQDNNRIDKTIRKKFESLYNCLDDFFPA